MNLKVAVRTLSSLQVQIPSDGTLSMTALEKQLCIRGREQRDTQDCQLQTWPLLGFGSSKLLLLGCPRVTVQGVGGGGWLPVVTVARDHRFTDLKQISSLQLWRLEA
jgi:hypothetical protein